MTSSLSIRSNYRNENRENRRLTKTRQHPYMRENDRVSSNRDSDYCIILVSNLPQVYYILFLLWNQDIITDDIEKFYGTFGDIKIVKIMYSKRDTALIEYFTHEMALQALKLTHNVLYRDKKLKVTMSYHTSISLPRPFERNPDLYTDYSTCDHHRFKVFIFFIF